MDLWELYDLAEDPNELRNRYADPDLATVRTRLHRELDTLRTQLGDADR